MTSTLTEPQAARHVPPRSQRSARRVGTVIVMLVSLVCAGLLRQVAADRQAASTPVGTAVSRSTLGNMNSFALALLLGGLRGPLVMFLWTSSENQKVDRNLEDLDTKIEWIRLLQPEFDTVHIFQIWNKAYNISVMMASPANKYTVIMEALDYARGVDEERPGDINILNSISNVYGSKLAAINLPEFAFYSRQFRQESLTAANRARVFPRDKTFRRLDKWKPLLDDANMIIPDLVASNRPRPSNVPAAGEWNDGSQLQYLKSYAPFPYGISPIAMSYNYAKRAEVAMNAEGQKPLQLSPMVVDSRPALQLKAWSEDEARRARRLEGDAFGIPTDPWNGAVEKAMAEIQVDAQLVNRPALDNALYSYAMADRLSRDAMREYDRHLSNPDYMGRRGTYLSHKADLLSTEAVCDADRDYLTALITSDPAEHKRLLDDSLANYKKAMVRFERTVLEFYTEDAAMASVHLNRRDVFNLDDQKIDPIYAGTLVYEAAHPDSEYADEQTEYGRSIARCQIRIQTLTGKTPATQRS